MYIRIDAHAFANPFPPFPMETIGFVLWDAGGINHSWTCNLSLLWLPRAPGE